jgi:hypothetical protein
MRKRFPLVSPVVKGFLRSVVGFKYAKLSLFALSIIAAYAYFTAYGGIALVQSVRGLGVLTAFASGILYAFGFTSPFAVGVFVSLDPGNDFWFAAFAGGLGALFADYAILKFVRFSFRDEFERLKSTRPVRYANKEFERRLPEKIKQYALLAMAGFVIASPLPDEIGVSLLAGFTRIEEKKFALVSFALNTLGIIVLLAL